MQKIPGQFPKIRTFGASLVSLSVLTVVSMQKGIETREQVKFICHWRKTSRKGRCHGFNRTAVVKRTISEGGI